MPNEIQDVSVRMPEKKRKESLKDSLLLNEGLTLKKTIASVIL